MSFHGEIVWAFVNAAELRKGHIPDHYDRVALTENITFADADMVPVYLDCCARAKDRSYFQFRGHIAHASCGYLVQYFAAARPSHVELYGTCASAILGNFRSARACLRDVYIEGLDRYIAYQMCLDHSCTLERIVISNAFGSGYGSFGHGFGRLPYEDMPRLAHAGGEAKNLAIIDIALCANAHRRARWRDACYAAIICAARCGLKDRVLREALAKQLRSLKYDKCWY